MSLFNHILVEAGQFLDKTLSDFGLGDKGAFAFLAHEKPFVDQIAERLPDDRPAHSKYPAQFRLTGQLIAGLPTPASMHWSVPHWVIGIALERLIKSTMSSCHLVITGI
jgi:hypothetical protein